LGAKAVAWLELFNYVAVDYNCERMVCQTCVLAMHTPIV